MPRDPISSRKRVLVALAHPEPYPHRPAAARAEWDAVGVIPTMLLMGLVVGRWWVIPLGGVAGTVLVVLAVSIAPADVPLAAALGAANVAVGVVARWAVVWAARVVVRVTQLARAA